MKTWEVLALGAPFLLAFAGWFALRANPLPPRVLRTEAAEEARVEPSITPGPAAEETKVQRMRASVSFAREPLARDEATTMAVLRSSMDSEPARTIEGARAAEAQFGRTAAAAERSWLVARSLVHLGRFHEARDEAQRAVRDFPDSTWALDLERHLLVQPLDLPPREDQAN